MSSILDALHKVEEEQSARPDHVGRRLFSDDPPQDTGFRARVFIKPVSCVCLVILGFMVGVWGVRESDVPHRSPQNPSGASLESAGLRNVETKTNSSFPVRPRNAKDEGVNREVRAALERESGASSLGKVPVSGSSPVRRDVFEVSSVPGNHVPSLPSDLHVEGTNNTVPFSEKESSRESSPRDAFRRSESALASLPLGSTISFLQWSPNVLRRKALIKIADGPFVVVREGDGVAGYVVEEIQENAVALSLGRTLFELRLR